MGGTGSAKSPNVATLNKPSTRTTWGYLLSMYLSILEANPIRTKTITGSLIGFIGDILCQMLFPGRWEDAPISLSLTFLPFTKGTMGIDILRLVRSTLWAAMLVPIAHHWYAFLERSFPGTSMKNVFQKVATDQLIYSPFTVVAFFLVQGLLRTGTLAVGIQDAHVKFISTITVNWCYWSIMQTVNFKLVPTNLQILFVNVVGVIWNMYLSYIANTIPIE